MQSYRRSSKRDFTLGYVAMGLLLAASGGAATLQVGPTRALTLPSAAAAIAMDGDVVEIDAGTYAGDSAVWNASNLTVRAVAGRAQMDAQGASIPNGKAIWVFQGDDVLVEDIEFFGADVLDNNGSGIRMEGSGLVVRRCLFRDNENGLLVTGGGDVLVEFSEFARNGFGSGFTHNILVGSSVDRFTLQHSHSYDAIVGNLVKSRAAVSEILYNRFGEETATGAALEIDISNGGLAYIIGNQIQQGPSAGNANAIQYGGEGTGIHPVDKLYVVNNTMVNDRTPAVGSAVRNFSSVGADLVNNIVVSFALLDGTAGTLTSNLVSATGTDVAFVDRAGQDYHLRSTSPAIDSGVDPGLGSGFDLTPVWQYVHVAGSEARPSVPPLDIGAYEFEPVAVPALDTFYSIGLAFGLSILGLGMLRRRAWAA